LLRGIESGMMVRRGGMRELERDRVVMADALRCLVPIESP
jgi:hypothetical protein